MTPPSNAAAVCGGCFLYEHRGVCPMARDAYGLQNPAELERRAEALRVALAQDAHDRSSLCQFVQIDASKTAPPKPLPAAPSHLLLVAATTPAASTADSKEPVYAAFARTIA